MELRRRSDSTSKVADAERLRVKLERKKIRSVAHDHIYVRDTQGKRLARLTLSEELYLIAVSESGSLPQVNDLWCLMIRALMIAEAAFQGRIRPIIPRPASSSSSSSTVLGSVASIPVEPVKPTGFSGLLQSLLTSRTIHLQLVDSASSPRSSHNQDKDFDDCDGDTDGDSSDDEDTETEVDSIQEEMLECMRRARDASESHTVATWVWALTDGTWTGCNKRMTQVRTKLAKSLVDKTVLTSSLSRSSSSGISGGGGGGMGSSWKAYFGGAPLHPVARPAVKQEIITRRLMPFTAPSETIDASTGYTTTSTTATEMPSISLRTILVATAAITAGLSWNALGQLPMAEYSRAFRQIADLRYRFSSPDAYAPYIRHGLVTRDVADILAEIIGFFDYLAKRD